VRPNATTTEQFILVDLIQHEVICIADIMRSVLILILHKHLQNVCYRIEVLIFQD